MALLALLRIAIVNNARARFPYFPVAIWLQAMLICIAQTNEM